jgi:Family of unknown function (DUF5906)
MTGQTPSNERPRRLRVVRSGNNSEAFSNGSTASRDPQIAELNENYALVVLGDSAAVMKGKGNNISFLKVATFRQWFANQFVGSGREQVTLANYWLQHPERRQYEGIDFAPNGRPKHGHYNLFQGFAVEPRQGDCSKFLAHLKDNVCRGDADLNDWVTGWFAQIAQQPETKPGTSLALRGQQGVGKTIVGEIIGSLLGRPHYHVVADPRFVTGRFNAHLASLLLLHADEAFWAGDVRTEGKIKDLITGTTHPVEYKGKETIWVNNYIRLFVTGNQDWVVPAALQERRFAVLDVGDEHMQEHEYFADIIAEMENGGREALLYHLLNFDLDRVNLREVPRTAALLEQQIASLTPERAWWLDILQRGKLPFGSEAGTCPSTTLFESYSRHAQRHGSRRRSIETQLGMLLAKLVPDLRRRYHQRYRVITPRGDHERREGTIYVFPPLPRCRQIFEDLLQQRMRWGRPNDDWECEEGAEG